jgi:hypothetical protein
LLDEFYHAVGQYLVYRAMLRLLNLNEELYLSVAQTVHDDMFQRSLIRSVIIDAKIKYVVVDLQHEVVEKWAP